MNNIEIYEAWYFHGKEKEGYVLPDYYTSMSDGELIEAWKRNEDEDKTLLEYIMQRSGLNERAKNELPEELHETIDQLFYILWDKDYDLKGIDPRYDKDKELSELPELERALNDYLIDSEDFWKVIDFYMPYAPAYGQLNEFVDCWGHYLEEINK